MSLYLPLTLSPNHRALIPISQMIKGSVFDGILKGLTDTHGVDTGHGTGKTRQVDLMEWEHSGFRYYDRTLTNELKWAEKRVRWSKDGTTWKFYPRSMYGDDSDSSGDEIGLEELFEEL